MINTNVHWTRTFRKSCLVLWAIYKQSAIYSGKVHPSTIVNWQSSFEIWHCCHSSTLTTLQLITSPLWAVLAKISTLTLSWSDRISLHHSCSTLWKEAIHTEYSLDLTSNQDQKPPLFFSLFSAASHTIIRLWDGSATVYSFIASYGVLLQQKKAINDKSQNGSSQMHIRKVIGWMLFKRSNLACVCCKVNQTHKSAAPQVSDVSAVSCKPAPDVSHLRYRDYMRSTSQMWPKFKQVSLGSRVSF